MTKLSRTQQRRADRQIGRVGGSLPGILLLSYALPIGIVVWALGSVVAMAMLVALILAIVAMVPIAGAVAVVGAVTLPVAAVCFLAIGLLATGIILSAQRAWALSESVRAWITAGLARRDERVARADMPTSTVGDRGRLPHIDTARGAEPFRARQARTGSERRLLLGTPIARPTQNRVLSGAEHRRHSFDVVRDQCVSRLLHTM